MEPLTGPPTAVADPSVPKPDVEFNDADVASMLQEQTASRQQELRTGIVQGSQQAPDRAAAVQQLSDQTGMPADVVNRHFEDIQKQHQFATVPYDQILKDSPATAAFLAEPTNAAVAHDDMENLGALEWLVTAPARAVSQALNDHRYGALRTKSLFGTLTPEETDLMNSYKYHAEDGGRLGAGDSWFRGAVTGGMKFATFLGSASPFALAGAGVGAVLGGVVGSIVPGPGTAAGIATGASLGFDAGSAVGLSKTAFETSAGPAYDQFLGLRDEYGRTMDPDVAKAAALGVGFVNAALMGASGEVLLKGIPGASRLTSALTADAVSAALRQPTIRAALVQMVKSYGTTLTEGTALTVGQRAVEILGSELAKTVDAKFGKPSPANDYGYGKRFNNGDEATAQPKGLGFLGPLERPDGGVMSEFSIGVNINGKETEIPTLVPTLSKDQVAQLLVMKDGDPLPPGIAAAATAYAQERIAAGKDPFAGPGEQQALYPEFARAATPEKVPETRTIPHRTAADVSAELWEAAKQGVQSFALAGAVGPALGFMHEASRASKAQQAPAFFTALAEGVTQSKTAARLPDALQAHLAAATKDGPLETVYAPVETWDTYWQSKGVDPAVMAAKVTGDPAAYNQAKQHGGDLPIPTARYAVTLAGSEHNAYFANELRLGPDEMNGREQAAFTEAVKAMPPPEPNEPPSAVRTAILTQLDKAGVPPATAEHYAALYDAAFGTMATRAGVDPGALYESYGLTVDRPALETPTASLTEPGPAPAVSVSEPTPLPDSSERRIAELERQLDTDPKTGVGSARAWEQAYPAADADPTLSVVSFDVNNFKAHNDTHGHQAGDDKLRAVAAAITQAATELGVSPRIFRPGGDEFTLIASNAHADAIRARAEEIFGTHAAGDKIVSLSGHTANTYREADTALNDVKIARKDALLLAAEKARPARPGGVGSEGPHADTEVSAASEAGPQSAHAPRERASADESGLPEGRGDGNRARDGGLSAARSQPAAPDELFVRRPLEENQPRFTPDVTRELERMLDELRTFPHVARTWTWLEGPKTGNAAGGAADIVAGNAGAPVYDDILYHAPVNRSNAGARKGQPAREATGTRGAVERAIENMLVSRDIASNLADGAIRVAERRAAGDWKDLSKPSLPPSWGTPAPQKVIDTFSADLDAGQISDATDAGGDASFDVTKFDQGPVDEKPPAEEQPALPGTEDVRSTENATPQLEAPFSLTGEAATRTAKQTTLFQQQSKAPDTPEFRAWFGDSKVVDEHGDPLVVYHGTARGDRVGNVFRKKRASSGPMAFFTTDKAIAEKYAAGKPDVSLEMPADYAGWFKFKPAGSRSEVDLDRAWYHLTPEQRARVIENLPTVGYADPDRGDGPIISGSQSITSRSHIEYLLKEARGNGLTAAKELWLASGSLFDQEERFLEVLHGLGVDGIRFDDPHATQPKVYDTFLAINNPLVTADIPGEVLLALEKRAGRQRRPAAEYGADFWDKRMRDAGEWIAALKDDYAKGVNSFVWSSIPDWVTRTLKELGYDGIHDTGGKMGGENHDVWIPFEPTQIKSASENRGTFDPTNPNIYYQTDEADAAAPATFYSRLERAVEMQQQAKASGAQWKASIKNAKIGINRDEFALARVEDLADGTTYTKQEVRDYLQANRVVVEPVILGADGGGPTEAAINTRDAWIEQRTNEIHLEMIDAEEERLMESGHFDAPMPNITVEPNPDGDGFTFSVDDDPDGHIYDTEEEAQEAAEKAAEAVQEQNDDYAREQLSDAARQNVEYSEAEDRARDEAPELPEGLATQYGDYVEPGGDKGSYREVFLTVPDVQGDPRPILAGITEQERTHLGAGGYRELIDDVTNDAANNNIARAQARLSTAISQAEDALRSFDFTDDAIEQSESEIAIMRKLKRNLSVESTRGAASWEDGHDQYSDITNPIVRLRYNTRTVGRPGFGLGKKVLFLEEVQPPHADQTIPALFKRNWREIGFKWALRQAAEQGLHAVAWTTGEMQAARYSLEKQVDSIQWKAEDGNWSPGDKQHIIIHTKGARSAYPITFSVLDGKVVSGSAQSEAWTGAPLENVVGKEMAEKILGTKDDMLSGEGLKIGGEGLKKLYNVDFKNVVNGLPAVKKFGGKVETLRLDTADEDTTEVPALILTPAMREAILGGQALFQGEDEGPTRRGSISFGADRQFKINLLEHADLSTFLHETGHFFLEVMGDLVDQVKAAPAETHTEPQRALLSDYGRVLQTFGVETRQDLTTAHHEQFARLFEAYLMEGKAPNVELQPTFARFRAWLVGIYQSLQKLHVTLTDPVRRVFDRLVASDTAIADAEAQRGPPALFTTAESAGLSPAEFGLYERTMADAHMRAVAELDRKLLADVQREQTRQWKAQRADIEQAVTKEFHAQPAYQALAAMRYGERPDRTPLLEGLETPPLKLSRDILVERYGAARLEKLPKPFVFTDKGGLDPDFVAEKFGFSSGDALLNAIEQAPPLKAAIDQETTRRMLAEHGSLLLDGTLGDKAKLAVANDDRDAVIAAEMRALGRLRRTVDPFVRQERAAGRLTAAHERAEREYERRWFEAEAKLRIAMAEGHKQVEIDALQKEVNTLKANARGGAATINAAIPPAGVLRDAARERIAGLPIRSIKPAPFWSASRRAAQQAIDRAARQDFDGAITAKQQELTNLAFYREAEKQREYVETASAFARDLNSQASRARIGKAGLGLQDQIDGILDRFDFAKISGPALDRRGDLRKWIAGIESQGLPVDLPESLLDESRRRNYQELPLEEFTGVIDGLKQLVHLARIQNRLLKASAKATLDETAGALAASIRTHFAETGRAAPLVSRDRTEGQGARRVAGFFASHVRLADYAREMDGDQDGGPMWDAFSRVANDAGAREAEMNAAATRALRHLVDTAYPRSQKRGLYVKQEIPAIGQSLSKMERLSIALNWGNEGSRDRIRTHEGWTDVQVRAILDTLDTRDLTFVQGVLDFIGSFKPQIAAKQQRVYGIEPTWVEATPITTAHGEIAGGYFPLKYDDRLGATAARNLDLEAGNLAKLAAYTQATTARGFTKERLAHVDLPLRRDFGPIFEHVGQVIHDLTHHETLIDMGRLLAHRAVSTAIMETQGDVVYKQIKGTIRDMAFGDAGARTAVESALLSARAGTAIAQLGWNLTTPMLHLSGALPKAIERVGPTYFAKGLVHWLRDAVSMENSAAWINEHSLGMKERGRTQQRELSEIRNIVGVNTGTFSGWVEEVLDATSFGLVDKQTIADSFFYLIQKSQQMADIPTYLGQFEKSRAAGETEARAHDIAYQAVLDAFGGGQIKDLPSAMRAPSLKMFTMFYGPFNSAFNLLRSSVRGTRWTSPLSVGRLGVDFLMLVTVPAAMGYGIRNAMGSEHGGDHWLLQAEAGYLADMMLGVRELAGALEGYHDYTGPAGTHIFNTLGKLIAVGESTGGKLAEGKPAEALDAKFWKALDEAGGILWHYPAGQINKTVGAISAMLEGKHVPASALIAGMPKASGQ